LFNFVTLVENQLTFGMMLNFYIDVPSMAKKGTGRVEGIFVSMVLMLG
jgi:hypothetical protein